jgi:uncharacterized membrane protein YkvA (DUF1232 family)
MAEAGRHGRRFQEWTASLSNDVQSTWELVTSEAVGTQGRRFLAGSLSYILTQLDLIPDHEKAGAIDDAFVIRVAYGLAAEHAAKVSTQHSQLIAKLTNEEDDIRSFLGDQLFAKLRRYVVELAEKTVRGRTTDQILSDPKAREDMKRELDQAIKKLKPALASTDAESSALELSVKNYLKMKLGA